MKDWFKARNLWGEMILALSDAEAGRLCKALWRYSMTGEQSDLSGAEKVIFPMLMMTLRQDEEREQDISSKRSAAGAIGGKQTQAKSSKRKQKQAKQANACNKNQNKNKNKNTEQEKESESDISTSCAAASATPNESEVFIRLPTIDGREYPVTFSDMDKARSFYPAVDVEQEIRNIAGWLDSNPTNRKTWGGMKRFINGWLAREQNKARTVKHKPQHSETVLEEWGGTL